MLGFITKMFGGSKSEKDVKLLQPIVQKVNAEFIALQSLSNDELRGKTIEFKERISKHLQTINGAISKQQEEAEALPITDITGRDAAYQLIDKLKRDRDEQIEEVLEEILPEAFAVVKETARRVTTNKELVSTATENDKALSIKKDYVSINGNQSVFQNAWTAGGNVVTWNMVHYDVQLIGGAVLHS